MKTLKKFNFILAFMLGIFFTLVSPIAAFANGDDILQKQQEVDKYVFETHAKEIANQGFQVTHTGPTENYVEIGITPYNEENANYLYEIFGTEAITVVEGELAVTFTTQTGTAQTGTAQTGTATITVTNSSANSVSDSSSSSGIPFFFYPLAAGLIVSSAVILLKKRIANK